MKIRNHKLTAVVLAGVLVVSIFTLVFAASISYKQIQSLTDSEKKILHSYEVNIELVELLSYIKDAEAGVVGYLLTNDSSFLKPYYIASENVKQSFIKLKLLVYHSAEQSANLDKLFSLINQRISFLGSILNKKAPQIDSSATYKKQLLSGKDIVTDVQKQVDKILAYELNLLRQSKLEHAKDLNLSPLSVLYIVIFSLFFFVVSYIKINKDLKGLAYSNNQLLINKEIFEHSEQIANICNWWWNKDENKLTYSNNIYHLLGCKRYEFEPTLEKFIEFVHPNDRHLVWEGNLSARENLITSILFFRVIRKDGAVRYFKSVGKVITDNYGKTLIIGMYADITEQYNKDKMIEDKIADLEKSNKELSAFNHIASHDLQEPLRKVQTFISRIREKDYDSFSGNVKDYFSGIERATSRMQMFIEDLLLYSRASNVARIFELTDLNELLDNSKQELSQRIEEKNAIIIAEILPTLNVIPFQVQQLFTNLLSNSIKYSKPDVPPVITIESRMVSAKNLPGWVTNPKNRYYKISISDNGIGFDPQHAEDIFTLFYRLHSKTAYSGTGVGLAICKVIAENHKGYIKAESTPGVGSTLIFYLPV
ncbi:MAG: CHASE3 domain-containing protein [Verrucomicrobia bacterium]|nr:CHASE3 domain-containing protein [Prolixibacteraceae bacterium]